MAMILIPPDPPSVAGASLQREGYPVQEGRGVKFRILWTLRCKVLEKKRVVGVKGSGHPGYDLEKKPRDDIARGSGQHASPCPTRPGELSSCLTLVGSRDTAQGFGDRSRSDPTRAREG